MPIKKLIIKNIKSYIDEEIDFSEGINCIIGKNGAGKSTIIESIGFAMFNSNKISQSSLIRYGEKEGSITLIYEALDGCDYSIYRKISKKGNGSCKITNLATNEVVEKIENVYPLIRKTLGIKQSKRLSDLFEEIIAVPQGNFVSLFLETASQRKEDFEALFNFDVYEKAYEKIKDIININNSKKNDLDKETALIKGQTEDYDLIVKEIEELNRFVKEQEAILRDINKDKSALNGDINELKNKQKLIDDINKEIKELNNSIESNKKIVKEKEHDLKEAQNAQIIVNNTINDHNEYLKYVNLVDVEEERVKKYHQYKEELNQINTKIVEINSYIKSEKIKLSQDDMKIKGIDIQINEKNEELKKAKEELNSKLDRKNNVDELYKEIEKEKEDQENNFDTLKDSLIQYKLQYQQTTTGKNIDVGKEKEILDDLKVSKKKKQLLEVDKNNLYIDISKLEIINQNLQSNKADLSCGICPIFKENCKNCGDKNNNFDELINKNKEQINSLKDSYNNIQNELKKYEDLDKKIVESETLIVEYNNYVNNTNNIVLRIKEENVGFDDIDDYDLLIKELEERLKLFKNNVDKKQESLKSIANEKDASTTDYNECEKTFNNLLFSKNSLIKQKEEFEKDVKIINLEIAKNNSALNIEKEKEKQSKEDMLKYSNAEENKTKYEELRNSLYNNHILYISNEGKSKEVEVISKQITSFENENKNLYSAIENKVKSLKEYADFDEGILEKKEENLKELELKESQINGLVSANKIQLKSLIEKEKEKAKLLEKLKDNEILINKYLEAGLYLENTRNILRDLPIKLSLQYRNNISKMATIFYQRISKENVSVDIDETYKVMLIDNAKPENVKDMNMLSGGEQMSLAIAIRVSMLKYLAGIDMYFLDEPTVNLDADRRSEIAEVIKDVSVDLKQLFVISHDDTFETITTSVLKVEKEDNISKLSN